MKGASAKKAIGISLVALALGGVGVAIYSLLKSPVPGIKDPLAPFLKASPILAKLKAMDKDRPAAANKIVDQLIKGKKPNQPGDGKVSGDFFTSITKGSK